MARFAIGNEDAKKWDEEAVKKIFIQMLENTANDEKILSLQDSILSVDLYSSSINYLVDKYPVFESIKKDIADVIIARINNKALNNEFNATASIWRFKQLGEKDEKVVDNKSSDGTMSPNSSIEDIRKAFGLDELKNPMDESNE